MRLFLGVDIEDRELLENGDGSYTVLDTKRTDEQKAKDDVVFERRNNKGVLENLAFTPNPKSSKILYETSSCAVRLNTDKWQWQLDKINLRTLIVARILFGGKISRMD